MADIAMRPRFQLHVACDAETLVEMLRDQIEESDPRLEGFFDARHCVLRIPPARRAFFSPELDVTFERFEDGRPGVCVRCLFGPRPAVWTGFAFVYAALAAAGVLGALWGTAQLTVGESPWALAAPGIALLAMGAVYASSFIGQGLAAAQMYQIRSYLADCIEKSEHKARVEPRTSLDSAQL